MKYIHQYYISHLISTHQMVRTLKYLMKMSNLNVELRSRSLSINITKFTTKKNRYHYSEQCKIPFVPPNSHIAYFTPFRVGNTPTLMENLLLSV